jgi:uncharacterized membrane protein YqhA
MTLTLEQALKSDSTHHFFGNACSKVRVITVFPVFRLLTDFVCLYTYEFCLSLWKIVRSHFNLPHNFKHENIVQIVTLTGDNINQLDNV